MIVHTFLEMEEPREIERQFRQEILLRKLKSFHSHLIYGIEELPVATLITFSFLVLEQNMHET